MHNLDWFVQSTALHLLFVYIVYYNTSNNICQGVNISQGMFY